MSLTVMAHFLSGPHNRNEDNCLNMNYSYFYDIYIKSFLFSLQGFKRKGAAFVLSHSKSEGWEKIKRLVHKGMHVQDNVCKGGGP